MFQHPPVPILLLLVCFVANVAHADEDDTRRLLNQINRSVVERERAHLVEDPVPGVDSGSLITIGETTYQVANTLADLGPAIYVAMNLRQWSKVRQFVSKYRLLAGHDSALVLLAEGMLAREDRDYDEAISKLGAALDVHPDNPRTKLELARAYFEDNQSREARALFEQVAAGDIPDEARPVIEGFQGALRERDSWHGSLSLGIGYNSNINQANGMVTVSEYCIPEYGCFPSTRTMPSPIRSSSMVYDLTLSRRWQLSGHHNVLLRGISYGRFHHQHKQAQGDSAAVHYDEATSIVYAGYNHLSAIDDIAITPLLEHNRGNGHSRYQAIGLRAEWKRNIGPRSQIGINAQRKHFRFKAQERQYFDNHDENQFGIFASHILSARTAMYGGLSYTRNQHALQTASSKEVMANAGVFHAFEAGFTVNATVLQRHLRHDARDEFLGGRRSDRQRIYMLNVGMPLLAFKGMTPNLSLKRTINNSNIDWAYKYQQTQIAIKFEKIF